ncbi:MAG: sugar phosphate isomerase/epimerase [Planctomyces sp.]|nr:sugar phosphate isomerase/epimerase [Planctomyces sp.]
MPLRLAVATEDFGSSLREAIAEAAKCPVSGIRLNARTEVRAEEFTDTGLRQLAHYIGEHQMSVAGLIFPSRSAVYDSENLDRRVAAIRTSMSLLRRLKTSELIVRCGRIPDPDDNTASAPADTPSNENVDSLRNPFSFAPPTPVPPANQPPANSEIKKFELLCEIVSDLVRHANHVGCRLQLQVASYDSGRINRLLDHIKTGPVQIVFDPATIIMTGGRMSSLFRDHYQQVGYVRARDAIRDIDGAGVEVAVGEGLADWPELIALLSEAHYDGWMCVERTGGDSRADDVRSGLAHICNLIMQGRH